MTQKLHAIKAVTDGWMTDGWMTDGSKYRGLKQGL